MVFHDLQADGFDPVLTLDEARGRPTDDAVVKRHIGQLVSSELLAVVHPNCWGAPPAMVKGWIDRVFAPQAAYTFPRGKDLGDEPIGLLALRAALILNTGNTRLQREVEHFGDPLDRIWRECLLSYCGVRTIDRQLYGVIAGSSDASRQDWLSDAGSRASRLAIRPASIDRTMGSL